MDSHTKNAAQIEIIAIVGVLVVAVLAATVLWRVGATSRRALGGKPRTIVLLRERDAYDVWRGYGQKGRVLVYFGKHLPIEQIAERVLQPGAYGASKPGYPNKAVTDDNYLFAALRLNSLRKIYTVVPENSWGKTKKRLEKNRKFSVGPDSAGAWFDGAPVVAGRLSSMPALKEPVMLNFSADYFTDTSTTAGEAYAALRRAALDYDIVTITPPPKENSRYEEALGRIRELKFLIANP